MAAATTPVTAPGILAPPDVVVGAAGGSVNLNVTLTAPGTSPVTVYYDTPAGTTSSRTACYGTSYGYVGQAGTSGFQEFTLNLYSNSADSTIVRAQTQIDITGDAAATSTPGLYVRDAVVDNSAGTINVPVLLGGPSGAASGSPVSVPYTTHNGSAAAGTDYTSTSGTLVFPAGETAENITVPILHRSGPAQARSFSVTLGTPTHATVADGTGVVTIEASGATPVSSPGILAPPDVVVGATDGYIDLPVTLTAPGTSPVTVYYDTPAGTTSSRTACYGTSYGYVGQAGTRST
ncbi:MAG: Calx-beta domain-containing protein [Streptosporangiaceae bacterium]